MTIKETPIEGSQYRIIPTKFPPVNFFERYTPPELMEEAFEIESLTNERLLNEVGLLQQVKREDRVSGPGASVVMAAFTHIGNASRFTDGSFGIYYAGLSLETAIWETIFHRERFFLATQEPPCEIDMRSYHGTIAKPLVDARGDNYQHLLDSNPDNYAVSQSFGLEIRTKEHWGILYPSVRHEGGECIAALRPPAISIPVQGAHLSYHWNGKFIDAVYEKKSLKLEFGKSKPQVVI
ncbi:MAG: RES family NAD+ phosphorylase [Pseudomonadales bacterium]|nr:RES family NAD+ phosphorylase [Pseudomonadales bacterium]